MVRAAVAAKWPAAIVTQKDIGLFTNEEGMVLTADSALGAAVLSVDDPSAIAQDMWLYAMAKDGILLLQVNSVDGALKTVTVDTATSRAKDGTTDVALKQGDRLLAAVPAIAVNQLRAEVAAIEATLGAGTFVAANAGAVLFIGPTGNIAIDLANFKYDDANDQLQLNANGSAAGLKVGDTQIYRGAADRLDLASGDSFNIVLGSFQMAAVTVFESDRDVAIALLPNANNTLDLGSTTRNWRDLYLAKTQGSVLFMGASGQVSQDNASLFWDDTNDLLTVTSANSPVIRSVRSTTDTNGIRNSLMSKHKTSADMVDGFGAMVTFAIEDSAAVQNEIGTVGFLRAGADNTGKFFIQVASAGVFSERLTLDAAGNLDIDAALSIGAVTIFESDRDQAISWVPSADNSLTAGTAARRYASVNSAAFNIYNASGDANAIYALLTTGLRGGAGGASAPDVFQARQAASVWEVTGSLAGSVRFGMSGAGVAFTSWRAAAADANPYAIISTLGLQMGPGGATAVRVTLAEGAANRWDMTASTGLNLVDGALLLGGVTFAENDRDIAVTILPNADNTLDLGSTARRWRSGYFGPGSVYIYAAASDANAAAKLTSGAVLAGAGGASALDVQWKRSGAAAWQARDGADAAYASVDVLSLSVGAVTVFEADRDLAVTLVPNADFAINLGTTSRRFTSIHAGTLEIRNAAGDANPACQIDATGMHLGAGGASAMDGQVKRSSATLWAFRTQADTAYIGIDILDLRIGSIVVFESDRDVAITLLPNATDTLDLGSATREWRDAFLSGNIAQSSGYHEFAEIASPSNPAANAFRLFAKDNGLASPNNRTQAVIRWSDGTETVVAESPAS